jgi:hypothetical protein
MLLYSTKAGRHLLRSQTCGKSALCRREAYEVKVSADSSQVWETTIRRLRDYLLAQGVPLVQLERATDPPRPDRVSDKLRQVWSEVQRKEEGAGCWEPSYD